MVQEPDKWQLRQAEALAAEEGLSREEAVRRVLGTTRPRAAKATPEGDKGKTPAGA